MQWREGGCTLCGCTVFGVYNYWLAVQGLDERRLGKQVESELQGGEEERRRKCKEIGSGVLIKGIQFILVEIQKSAMYICVKKIINEACKRNFLREDHRIGFN